MYACLTIALLRAAACSPDAVLAPPTSSGFIADPADEPTPSAHVGEVDDLRVSGRSGSSISLAWTHVDNGLGAPAEYRLKFATPPLEWDSAEIGCEAAAGPAVVGAPATCTVQGLAPSTTYEFQLASFRRSSSGAWVETVYSNVVSGTTGEPDAGAVDDLEVVAATESTLTVRWTEVDDGLGSPARYRVKYGTPPIDYATATIGCDRTIHGVAIGAEMSCTITGLEPETTYDVQLSAYRSVDGEWHGATVSNVAQGSTSERPAAIGGTGGIWLSRAEIAALPASGEAWVNLLDEASGSCGRVDLADQAQRNNVCVLAKALVFARTGTSSYRSGVVDAIRQIVEAPTYDGRALALGRELAAYVVAADLIDLASYDPQLDASFRRELRELLTTHTHSGPKNLVECHERRPNNWGTMCGASRIAVAAYLGDTQELERAARVFRGWLGERSYYAGFAYGDLSWQCDPERPVGINPRGCTRYGRDLGGILPDDQRRGGSFTWPPPHENYVWEALQGAVVQAVLLERAGYPAFQWGDQALLRAVQFLHAQLGYEAEGDDGWQSHLFNYYYGSSFPAPVPTPPGKIMGWSDWTHR